MDLSVLHKVQNCKINTYLDKEMFFLLNNNKSMRTTFKYFSLSYHNN